GDLLVTAADQSGDLDEDLRALVRRQRLGQGALSRIDGTARLVGPAPGNAADDFAGVGGADLDPVAGLHPLAVDQQPTLRRRCGHRASVGERSGAVAALRGAGRSLNGELVA